MAKLKLSSERQLQSNLLSTLIAELGLNDINPGSVNDILTQSIAQNDFALMYRIAQVSRLTDIKNVKGDDLDTLGFSYGLTRHEAKKATGLISILREASFVKVSSAIYAGLPAPVAGTNKLYVVDASSSLIGTSGTLIVGRGTLNEEEVTYSSAPILHANYAEFTLDSNFVNSHSSTESVILKQGLDVVITAGTIVRVPATATSDELQFKINNDVTLLAGEDRLDGVNVTAITAGTSGNIPSMAINGTQAFPSPPFAGARAENPAKFTTGVDRESDDEFRDRIQNVGDTLTRGVKQAILQAITGVIDPDTAKRVVSASVVLPVDEVGPVKVYIDDGTGFEPSFESVGYEPIRLNATGGEKRFQLNEFPIVKAAIETTSRETYDFSSGPLTLIVEVGPLQETITFTPADFSIPELATAEEVVAVINDDSNLLEARTSQVGTKIMITAKQDENEDIRVVGGTANDILNFPLAKKETISLYLNDRKLSKDGITATLESTNLPPYNLSVIGAFPHTLTLVVDGKSANPQTATVDILDVADPTSVSAQEIVDVLNRDLVGIEASVVANGTAIRIQSLSKLSEKSKLEVTGGTLNDASEGLNIPTTEVQGRNSDFKFNRELGLLELNKPLGVGDNLTIGTPNTRAFVRASLSEPYAPMAGTTLVIDGSSQDTITFDSTFSAGKSAQETADFINENLSIDAFARVRNLGGFNYLEIVDNSFKAGRTLEINPSSTANTFFEFELGIPSTSVDSNTAYLQSNLLSSDQEFLSGFNFTDSDNLVVLMDQNPASKTFNIPMYQNQSLTGATSDSDFEDSTLNLVFPEANDLVDWSLTFTSGVNTGSMVINSVTNTSDSEGANIMLLDVTGSFTVTVGDVVEVTGLTDAENNGKFFVASVAGNIIGVYNPEGVDSATETGSMLVMQRRTVLSYNNLTGALTTNAFSSTPSPGDSFYLTPHLAKDVVALLSNSKITALGQYADITFIDGSGSGPSTNIQISSKENGSDGAVQITGGLANREFRFSLVPELGTSGYDYWTGLVALVHKIIYGDDSDLVSYPGVGAAGVVFQVLAPTVKEFGVRVTLTLREGVSISTVENEVKSAITGYINSLGVGQDVIVEEIRAAVIRISGIVDVILNDPELNIPIADNELARVSINRVVVG